MHSLTAIEMIHAEISSIMPTLESWLVLGGVWHRAVMFQAVRTLERLAAHVDTASQGDDSIKLITTTIAGLALHKLFSCAWQGLARVTSRVASWDGALLWNTRGGKVGEGKWGRRNEKGARATSTVEGWLFQASSREWDASSPPHKGYATARSILFEELVGEWDSLNHGYAAQTAVEDAKEGSSDSSGHASGSALMGGCLLVDGETDTAAAGTADTRKYPTGGWQGLGSRTQRAIERKRGWAEPAVFNEDAECYIF